MVRYWGSVLGEMQHDCYTYEKYIALEELCDISFCYTYHVSKKIFHQTTPPFFLY